MTPPISRRSVLKATGTAVGAVAIGTTLAPTPAGAAGAAAFAHPGLLHTRADLDRMAAKVKAGAEPYTAGFAKLTANRHAQSSWVANPQTVVYRGQNSPSPQNYWILYRDIHAAYQNALRYHVSGDTAYADTAVAILNAWSAKLTRIDGDADRFLAAGIYGYQAANAAELVRDHDDFELERFQKTMLDVFCKVSQAFIVDHNGTYPKHYWANWDLCNLACVMATGIFCDDRARFEQAVEYFKNGDGLAAVRNAIPVVHDDGLAEWHEAGRDQPHSLMGVGLMATVCEMAWNQGIDLYGYDDNRFLKGAQYVAKWSLGGDVPYTPSTRERGSMVRRSVPETTSQVAPADPAMTRPVWAMIANHYTKRRGLSATYVTQAAAKVAPEGGGGDYGWNSGGFDQLGFGTLAFTRDRAADTAASPGSAAADSGGAGEGSGPGAGSGSGASPQGGTPSTSASPAADGDLAATGSDDIVGWTAAAGVTAIAGGLLFLRRRDRIRRDGRQ
ncbi:alginate lyase family protein [Streptomyces sp. NBC_00286]|uniref:alginate lyase family protein n=1 Tax=Streptomyces sp. NBC_00286 TaxID=2975701 RepID=UPI002E29EBC1|nr:alginate lyase family protein [Streptomyces sp. NBC_00286]